MQQNETHMEQQCTLIAAKIVRLIGQDTWDKFKKGASAMFALETMADLVEESDRQATIASIAKDNMSALVPEIQSITVQEYLSRESYYKDLQDKANVALLGDHADKVLSMWREWIDLRSHLAFEQMRQRAGKGRNATNRS